jgi:hypothetical protein
MAVLTGQGVIPELNLSLLYSSFWVIPRRPNFMCLHFIGRVNKILGRVNKILVHTAYKDESVPKRRRIKFRRRGISEKTEYDIHNTAKV